MKLSVFLIIVLIPFQAFSQNQLDIIHIDIGQGAATLIQGPLDNGKRVSVLFDAGQTLTSSSPDDGGLIIHRLLSSLNIKELDFFIVSHYDTDHYGGLVYGTHNTHRTSFALGPNNVPGNPGDDDNDGNSDWSSNDYQTFDFSEWGKGDDIKIKTIVDRGTDEAPTSKSVYKKYTVFTQAVSNHVTISNLNDIENFTINLGGGATIKCLAANGIVIDKGAIPGAESENERSISFLVEYGAFDYLVSGDLIGKRGTSSGPEDARSEYHVGRFLKDQDINLDVLQANHHGANNASELGFLKLAQPDYAIISVGANTYGHPYPDHLERLASSGVKKIYQTNRGNPKWTLSKFVKSKQRIVNGNILLSTNGVSFTIDGDIYICDN